MTNPIEMAMYDISQFFLYPVLLAIAVLFVHAFYALGAFAWQAWQRTQGKPAGFELHALRRADPGCDLVALETVAVKRLEFARIATRVAPMLGLVATMIPMGPALKALADGALQDVSRSLMIAFSAVILALLAAIGLAVSALFDPDEYMGTLLFAGIAIILGAIGTYQQKKGRGLSIAGLVLGGLALLISLGV